MAKKRNSGIHAFRANEWLINDYARQIRSLSREIIKIAAIGDFGDLTDAEMLVRSALISAALDRYSEAIGPWAESVASKMFRAVAIRNDKEWREVSKSIGRQISTGFDNPVIDATIRETILKNTSLIKNIPRESGERISRIVRAGLNDGKRADTIARELMATEGFAKNRANLIARTEISKATTEITRVRAVEYGSPGYIWRTSKDGAVRDSHAKMEGVFVEWDKPQALDGMTGHAGEFPNCRCYPEVVVSAYANESRQVASIPEEGLWQKMRLNLQKDRAMLQKSRFILKLLRKPESRTRLAQCLPHQPRVALLGECVG